ncbi:cell wall-active antibiotics response protein LiaF [Paenibacillus gansuensis]|uniref:Cell wall-active antibiotics response protein LiaF n=1 Tax=Paenibacillus gansuensis TaxID=306542 RepID=A0ABW5PGL8_9BACL
MNGTLFHRMLAGLLLIGIGSLFLLQQFGMIHMNVGEMIGKCWPLFLIYFGGYGAYSQWQSGRRMSQWIWSLIPFVLGLYFLGRNFGLVQFSIGELFQMLIPVLLIVIGLNIFLRPQKQNVSYHNPYTHEGPLEPKDELSEHAVKPHPAAGTPRPDMGASGEEWKKRKEELKAEWKQRKSEWKHNWHHHNWHHQRSKSSFIGDVYLGHDFWELEPLSISQFIGDTVLDLTKAQIPYGETQVNISSFIGDVKVLVPNDIEVGIQVQTSSFLGDTIVLDKRHGGLFKNTSAETPSFTEAEKKVRLVTSTFIGDVNVVRVG